VGVCDDGEKSGDDGGYNDGPRTPEGKRVIYYRASYTGQIQEEERLPAASTTRVNQCLSALLLALPLDSVRSRIVHRIDVQSHSISESVHTIAPDLV